jgi:hypothetical protein
MRLRTTLLLLTAFLLAQHTFAQKDKKKPNKDVEVIDFGETEDKTEDKSVYHGLILKTSPVSFIFGRQSVELEKEINDYLSIQGGVGVTFEPLWASYGDLLAEITEEYDGFCESDNPAFAYDECDSYSDFTIRSGKVGYQFSLSPRLFFDSDGFEGMYIAPVLRSSTQKFDVQRVYEGLSYAEHNPADLQQESVKNFDLLVHYGGQTLHPKLSVEWFIGGGMRFRNSVRQDIGFDFNQQALNGERRFKDRKFRLEAGIRVGFQL